MPIALPIGKSVIIDGKPFEVEVVVLVESEALAVSRARGIGIPVMPEPKEVIMASIIVVGFIASSCCATWMNPVRTTVRR